MNKKIFSCFLLSLYSAFANAAVITTQYTRALIYERNCPNATDEASCIAEDAGSGILKTSGVGNDLMVSDGNGTWTSVTLDPDIVSLPQVKSAITTTENQRTTTTSLGVQGYLWSGDTQELTITATFDYTASVGIWDSTLDSGAVAVLSAYSGSDFLLVTDLPDFSNNTEIAYTEYLYADDDQLMSDVLREITMSISFTVDNGDEFLIYGLYQGVAMNGAYFDSSNSFATSVSAGELTQEELLNYLQPITVPEPGIIGLFTIGLAGLGWSRRDKV